MYKIKFQGAKIPYVCQESYAGITEEVVATVVVAKDFPDEAHFGRTVIHAPVVWLKKLPQMRTCKIGVRAVFVQRCEKRLVNLVKQDPGRVRQNS